MGNSDPEEESAAETEVPARGRPVGKTDSTKRYQRTAADISHDKITIAQMQLDALKQSEEQKLTAKQAPRRKRGQHQLSIMPFLRSQLEKEDLQK